MYSTGARLQQSFFPRDQIDHDHQATHGHQSNAQVMVFLHIITKLTELTLYTIHEWSPEFRSYSLIPTTTRALELTDLGACQTQQNTQSFFDICICLKGRYDMTKTKGQTVGTP